MAGEISSLKVQTTDPVNLNQRFLETSQTQAESLTISVQDTLQQSNPDAYTEALKQHLETLRQMKAEKDKAAAQSQVELQALKEELAALKRLKEIRELNAEIDELKAQMGIETAVLPEPAKNDRNDGSATIDKALNVLSSASSPRTAPKHTDWKDDTIYFVLTDRFNDGDKTNNYGVEKNDINRYHGGDLQGIIDKLGYIKDLGVSSIWISPVMSNQDTYCGYHGYWPIDFFNIDKHLGDMSKFEELITKAHEKNLKIILDIPLNHTAYDHPFARDPSKYNWFHHNGDVQNWEDQWQAENCSIFGLPDLAQENPDVEKYLFDVAKFWIDKKIDGFRLDAVKNIPLSFWTKFNNEIHKYAGDNFLLVGECFDSNPDKLVTYQSNDMDSLFDYPLYFAMKDVFAYGQNMSRLSGHLDYENRTYPRPELMSSFLDNHDTQRFLTETGNDKSKFKLALACMMTLNRVPTIYYGTEVGMDSNYGGVEMSRKDMEWDKDPELLGYFKYLTSIRNSTPALTQGSFKEMWQDDKVFSYSRMMPDQEVIVVLNNGTDNETRDIPLRAESSLPEGTCLKDLLSDTVVTVKDHKLHMEMNGKQARILTRLSRDESAPRADRSQSEQGQLTNCAAASPSILTLAISIYETLMARS